MAMLNNQRVIWFKQLEKCDRLVCLDGVEPSTNRVVFMGFHGKFMGFDWGYSGDRDGI